MTTQDLFTPHDSTAPRRILVALLGTATFGAAAGLGHGVAATLRGAWMSPTLFLGAALLATPPLYLACMYADEQHSAEELITRVLTVLGSVGVVLLGLSAPAAFFSSTLRTPIASVLLVGCMTAVGAMAVHALLRRTFTRASVAAVLWTLFALAIGLRLFIALRGVL